MADGAVCPAGTGGGGANSEGSGCAVAVRCSGSKNALVGLVLAGVAVGASSDGISLATDEVKGGVRGMEPVAGFAG